MDQPLLEDESVSDIDYIADLDYIPIPSDSEEEDHVEFPISSDEEDEGSGCTAAVVQQFALNTRTLLLPVTTAHRSTSNQCTRRRMKMSSTSHLILIHPYTLNIFVFTKTHFVT